MRLRRSPAASCSRHSVSALHVHLVFVTKYRRPVFDDAMLRVCESTMRDVCATLNVEFNGDPDHVHLLVAYPATLAVSVLVNRLAPLPRTSTLPV